MHDLLMTKCCNNKDNNVETLLKESGFNVTKAKKKILSIFVNNDSPLCAADLLDKLPEFNESTIFRNLNQLSNSNLLSEVDLGEGFKRFEIKPKDHHHHHIKCNSCGKIDIINTCNLDAFSKELKKLGYKNLSHKIEFFGDCKTCLA